MKKNVSYGIHAAVLAVSVILAVASSFVAYPMSDLKLTCGYGIAAVVLDLVMLLVLKKDKPGYLRQERLLQEQLRKR